MVRNLLFLVSVILFLACNNPDTKHNNGITRSNEHTEHKEHHTELSLNNGVKWQSDESTRLHASKLNASVSAFNQKTAPELEEYQIFALEVQNELDALIRDCKMKGPDHDALHQWLEPVLESVKALKKAGSEDQGATIVKKLTAQVQKFNQYFI